MLDHLVEMLREGDSGAHYQMISLRRGCARGWKHEVPAIHDCMPDRCQVVHIVQWLWLSGVQGGGFGWAGCPVCAFACAVAFGDVCIGCRVIHGWPHGEACVGQALLTEGLRAAKCQNATCTFVMPSCVWAVYSCAHVVVQCLPGEGYEV
eukprot:5142698-Alexandrium_andersonii.AAC.1